jgi:hypothetical protein
MSDYLNSWGEIRRHVAKARVAGRPTAADGLYHVEVSADVWESLRAAPEFRLAKDYDDHMILAGCRVSRAQLMTTKDLDEYGRGRRSAFEEAAAMLLDLASLLDVTPEELRGLVNEYRGKAGQ